MVKSTFLYGTRKVSLVYLKCHQSNSTVKKIISKSNFHWVYFNVAHRCRKCGHELVV